MNNPFDKYNAEEKEAIKEAILHSFASIKLEGGELLDHYSKWYPVYVNELMPYVYQLAEEEWIKNGFERGKHTYRSFILKILNN